MKLASQSLLSWLLSSSTLKAEMKKCLFKIRFKNRSFRFMTSFVNDRRSTFTLESTCRLFAVF